MGCACSSEAERAPPGRPSDLSVVNSSSAARGSQNQLSPALRVSSGRFRSSTNFDINSLHSSADSGSILDLVAAFYELPDVVRYFLRAADKEDLDVTDDALIDASNLLKGTGDILANSLYPPGSMTSSSIIRFASREAASDKFLKMIESTYNSTQRTAHQHLAVSCRVNLILKNGTSKALVFGDAWKYWVFVRALKRSARGASSFCSVECTWLRHSGVAPTAEKSFWSGFGSKSSSDSILMVCEIAQGCLKFTSSNGKDVAPPETPVSDILAITLSADYAPVRSVTIEVNFLSHSWDAALLGGAEGSELCVEAHHSARAAEVPMTFLDLGSRKFLYLSEGDFDGSDSLEIRVLTDNKTKSVERIEVGKHVIKLNIIRSLLQSVADKETAQRSNVIKVDKNDELSNDSVFQGNTALPTLRPFHPRFPSAALVEHILLAVPDKRRMLKLVIHSALDLLGGEQDAQALSLQNKMNVYCIVELYSCQRELLSPSNFHRTPTVSGSLCPSWETEFNFPLQVDGKDVETIVIKVKDASGYLRHKMVGQISIPTSVFISVSDMALLRLPIESIDFNGEFLTDYQTFDSFGTISVGTQTCPRNDKLIDKIYSGLVDDKALATENSATAGAGAEVAGDKDSRPRMYRQMSAAGQAVVSVCVRELSVPGTCWPYETLYTAAGVSPSGAFGSTDCPPIISISFGKGHLFTGADDLVLLPGDNFDNSLLRWCAELDPTSSMLEPVLRIPWNQVTRIETITDTTIVVTALLHRSATAITSNTASVSTGPVQGMEKFKQTSQSTFNKQTSDLNITGTFEAHLLVAPCPSVAIAKIIYERLQLVAVRGMVKSFLRQLSLFRQVPSSEPGTANNGDMPFTSTVDTLSLAKSVLRVLERNYSLLSIRILGSFSSGSSNGMNTAPLLENDQLQRSISFKAMINMSDTVQAAQSASMADCDTLSCELNIKLRLRLLIALMVDGCSIIRDGLPGGALNFLIDRNDPSSKKKIVSRAKDLLKHDVAGAVDAVYGIEEGSADKFIRQIYFITEASLDHLREAILCGWDDSFPGNISLFADTMIAETLAILRKTVNACLESKEVFRELDGHANRSTFIKYVLENNSYFCTAAETILGAAGLSSQYLSRVRPGTEIPEELMLLNANEISNMISIYSSTLISETKSWLAKTLDHFSKSKKNLYDLPWDIDRIGKHYISPIPETLRLQLNVYLLVCQREDDTSWDARSIQQMIAGTCRSSELHTMAMLQLSESIVKSLLISLRLVADEYMLALQSKHWEDASESTERMNNIHFLVSVANDCSRILNTHLPDILEVLAPEQRNGLHVINNSENNCTDDLQAPDMFLPTSSLAMGVQIAFKAVTNLALKSIVRVIFSDMLDVLVDFDLRWADAHSDVYEAGSTPNLDIARHFTGNSLKLARTSVLGILPGLGGGSGTPKRPAGGPLVQSNPVEIMIATMADYLKDLQGIVASTVFADIPILCSQVFVTRYLIFLRNTAQKVKSGRVNFVGDKLVKAIESDFELLLEFMNSCAISSQDSATMDDYRNLPADPVDPLPMLQSKLEYIKKFIVIIKSQEVSDVKLQILLRDIANSYGHSEEGVATIECMLRTASALHFSDPNYQSETPLPMSLKGNAANTLLNERNMFLDLLMEAWSRHLSGVRRKSLNAKPVEIDQTNDPFCCAFGGVESFNEGGNGAVGGIITLRSIREKAANITINPRDADKKKRDAATIVLLRSLGLLEPERSVPTPPASADEVVRSGEHPSESLSTMAKRRSSARETFRAVAALATNSLVSEKLQDADPTVSDTSSVKFTTNPSMVADVMVFNIKAKNLRGSAVFGSPNPYIVISIGMDRPSQKTVVRWNSKAETTWDDEFVFRGVDIGSLARAVMDVKVYDKERIRRKRLLGAVQIRLAGLDARTVDSWFALEGGSGGSNGDVHLSIMLRRS